MSFFRNVLRSTDLLNVQFEFVNLAIDATDRSASRLRRESDGAAFIVVRLPPQHVAEDSLQEGATRAPPYEAFLASPSRLAFQLPPGEINVPFNVRSVLQQLTTLSPFRVEDAPPDGNPATFVEFPDRLLLVPDCQARVDHRFAPLLQSDDDIQWAEIWHTRFVVTADRGAKDPLRFRAVANPMDVDDRPVNTALKHQDRLDIVTRGTAAAQQSADAHVVASPQFIMSALGTTARLRSAWLPDASSSPLTRLDSWEHDGRVGRDRYVRIVRHGFCFPFGHRASLTTITQRELLSFPELASTPFNTSGPFALLGQHTELTVQEPERSYNDREMPFKRVRIVSHQPLQTSGRHTAHQVSIAAIDSAGTVVLCDTNMLFLLSDDVVDSEVLDQYAGVQQPIQLNYQSIVIADASPGAGDTTVNVDSLTFGVRTFQPGELADPTQPLFGPIMAQAVVSIPALERLQGNVSSAQNQASRAKITIKFGDDYKKHGFDPPNDVKQVFAEFVSGAVAISIPAPRAGGLAAPQFTGIDGVSRTMGPVTGVAAFLDGAPPAAGLNPIDLVGSAKILGSVSLSNLIEIVPGSAIDLSATNTEQLFNRIDTDDGFVLTRPVMTTVKTAQGTTTRFGWKPQIRDDGFGPITKTAGPIQLMIHGSVTTGAGNADDAATYDVSGTLKPFGLSIGGLATVSFTQLYFRAGAASKMEVTAEVESVTFTGDLAFAQTIQDILPFKGLGGAVISPQPDGVVVSYTLAVPSAGMGILSFENIAFVLSVSIPFLGDRPVAVRFSLSERNSPFTITVTPFGGTGFFALDLRTGEPDGTVMVEAAIEFGGILAFNLLDVVSGGVYVYAGVYMSMGGPGSLTISAHVRIGGYVDVLGIVSVSIEVYLGLTYADNELSGDAVLTIGVHVLLFNQHFSFPIHKKIAHLGAVPGDFALLNQQFDARQQWATYCKAFA